MAQLFGILGGTFDPVHNAHLALADAARSALGLANILWLPTGAPPYRAAPVAAATHRVAMLRLAIAAEPRDTLDERELQPGSSGYTFDSVASLQREHPERKYMLVMGADQYEKRASWHRWADLERLCGIAVVARPGWNVDAGATVIPMNPLPVSASDIRARLSRGEDVSAMLPPRVLGYIQEKGLYR